MISKNTTPRQADMLSNIIDDAAQKLTAHFEDIVEETSESDDFSLTKKSALKRCDRVIKIADQLAGRLLSLKAKINHPEL